MTVNELVSTFVLHDSVLENIEIDRKNNKVILTVDFCYWLQNNYEDSMPEMGAVNVVFSNVQEVNCPLEKGHSYGIVSSSLRDEQTLVLFVEDLKTNKESLLSVSANNVALIPLK